jgi:ribosomal protein S21
MANINVELTKNPNENTSSLIRRFTRRMQGSGIVRRIKSIRYNERKLSETVAKKKTLKRIIKTAEFEKLKKLGKDKKTRR